MRRCFRVVVANTAEGAPTLAVGRALRSRGFEAIDVSGFPIDAAVAAVAIQEDADAVVVCTAPSEVAGQAAARLRDALLRCGDHGGVLVVETRSGDLPDLLSEELAHALASRALQFS
jgi:hypothetical protein